MTQNEAILTWLKSGRTLTPLEALREFGSLRLGARIFELRQQGHNILTAYITKGGKTFAEYSIKKQFAEALF